MAWDSPSPWVVTVGQAQDRAARAAGALNLGGIFLRGREIAQRRKEFEAEEPLRKAQEEINDLRKEEARLRLDTLMEQRRNIHETQNDIGSWVGQFGRLQTIGL